MSNSEGRSCLPSLRLPALVTLVIGASAVFAACAGDDESSERAAPAETETEARQETRSTAEDLQEARRERERDREEDRKFDEAFRETRFDKLVAKLPIRKPPLYVEQYITTDGSHKVYTAVNRKRFLCELDAGERRRAVARFYEKADEVFRAGGVEDFVQVVTVTSETADGLPALATARKGSVSLTPLGRARGRC